jgi:hypothetical protein
MYLLEYDTIGIPIEADTNCSSSLVLLECRLKAQRVDPIHLYVIGATELVHHERVLSRVDEVNLHYDYV